jgi:hypothetical protein
MLQEYHARLTSQERERDLRVKAELARLHADASVAAPSRRRWARVRRRAPEPHLPPVVALPASSLRPSPQ